VTVIGVVKLSGFTASGTADTRLTTTAALSGNGQMLTITLTGTSTAGKTQSNTSTVQATYVSTP
jgi:hypothetical protein